MERSTLQGFFRIGMFIGGCGFVMIFLQPRGSAGFVLSVCSALIGAAMMVGVALLVRFDFFGWLERMDVRRAPPDERPPGNNDT